MPTVQVRNPSLQQLESADLLDVEANNFCAEWYDSGGFGANYIAAITVPLAATRHNFAPQIYVMASNILTITEAGFYFFNYTVQTGPETPGDGAGYAFLQQDPATGTFADLIASMAMAVSVAGSAITIHSNVILKVEANYRYRLMAASAGTNYQLRGAGLGAPNGSRFSVIRLYKNG